MTDRSTGLGAKQYSAVDGDGRKNIIYPPKRKAHLKEMCIYLSVHYILNFSKLGARQTSSTVGNTLTVDKYLIQNQIMDVFEICMW